MQQQRIAKTTVSTLIPAYWDQDAADEDSKRILAAEILRKLGFVSKYVHSIMVCRQISILRACVTAIGKAVTVEDVNTAGKRRTQTLSTHTTISSMPS